LDNAARFRQIILQKKRLKAEKLQKMKREMQRQNQARLQQDEKVAEIQADKQQKRD
jgi:hypothetical protein